MYSESHKLINSHNSYTIKHIEFLQVIVYSQCCQSQSLTVTVGVFDVKYLVIIVLFIVVHYKHSTCNTLMMCIK